MANLFYQEYINKIYMKNSFEFYQSSWFNVIKINDFLLYIWKIHYRSTFGGDFINDYYQEHRGSDVLSDTIPECISIHIQKVLGPYLLPLVLKTHSEVTRRLTLKKKGLSCKLKNWTQFPQFFHVSCLATARSLTKGCLLTLWCISNEGLEP